MSGFAKPVTKQELAVLFDWPADSLGGFVVIGVPAERSGIPMVAVDTADLSQVINILAYVIGSISSGGVEVRRP